MPNAQRSMANTNKYIEIYLFAKRLHYTYTYYFNIFRVLFMLEASIRCFIWSYFSRFAEISTLYAKILT